MGDPFWGSPGRLIRQLRRRLGTVSVVPVVSGLVDRHVDGHANRIVDR